MTAEIPRASPEAGMLIGGEWVGGRRRPAHRGREPVAARAARHRAARRRRGRRPSGRAPRPPRSPRGARSPRATAACCSPRIADDLADIGEELARIIAAETGNAIRTQARGEAATSADVFRYFGGVASEQKGEVLPLGESMLSYSVREPLGVVAAIVPWNAPVLLASLKVAMALCTGNTLVLKAAEDAPLGVLRMAEVCARAPARRRAERRHGLRRGVRRRAAQPPRHREDLLHRLDRGRADRDARRRRADPARVARARRQGPGDRLPGLQRRRHGRARHHRHALRPPGPVMHGRLAAVRAPEHLRRLHRATGRAARRARRRRRARRAHPTSARSSPAPRTDASAATSARRSTRARRRSPAAFPTTPAPATRCGPPC